MDSRFPSTDRRFRGPFRSRVPRHRRDPKNRVLEDKSRGMGRVVGEIEREGVERYSIVSLDHSKVCFVVR